MTAIAPIVPGLCSVTFRSLDAATVARHAADCHLRAIEWGSDVHVPVGDLTAARGARTICGDLGLVVASYGSYLSAGRIGGVGEVRAVLDTAAELGASNVRVWAHGAAAAADLSTICAEAQDRGLAISLEYHPGTATETAASTNSLLDTALGDNLSTYWQPDPSLAPAAALAELEAVLPRVSHLHVFWWQPDYTRLPLADGGDLWLPALRLASGTTGRVALIEFVRDDDPVQLRADASALHSWLGRLGGRGS